MIEVEADNTEIVTENSLDVTAVGNNEVVVETEGELDISVLKREFTIVGDDIYIPMLYDDAPQWMKDLVQLVVDVSISTNNTSLINDLNAMLQAFATSYVPLNQYTQSILDLSDEDTRINALLTTLNSNFNDGLSNANAQIINLDLTKAGKDEVVASVIQTIAAQLADVNSSLGATIKRMDQAQVTETTARANSFHSLTASITNINGEIQASAEVIDNVLTYVGIDEAGASTSTGLSAYLEASNGVIGGADSQLANTIRVTAEGVESKWAYNSVVNVNGVYRKSGFGLTTNNFSGAGTQANPYNSEFWIDASRLKFTNSNMTGSKAPFTIDATGVTPEITFNGIVSFSNVTGGSTALTTAISSNNNTFAQKIGYANYSALEAAATYGTTIINGGYLRTSLIQANAIVASQINTVGLIAENISANEIVGKTITGGTINGARINAAIIKASYLDLNGELEVLTNYIISVATYNANPSLYTDAVYIAADNQYRIPTLSLIRESAQSATYGIGQTGSLTGVMWAYNKGNAGSNLKAVKIQPTFTVASNSVLIASDHSWYDRPGDFIYSSTKNRITISLAGIELFRYNVEHVSTSDANHVTLSGPLFGTIDLPSDWIRYQSPTHDCNIGIGTLRVKVEYVLVSTYIDVDGNTVERGVMRLTGTLLAGDRVFPYYWQDSSRLVVTQAVAPYGSNDALGPLPAASTISISSNIMINNMV